MRFAVRQANDARAVAEMKFWIERIADRPPALIVFQIAKCATFLYWNDDLFDLFARRRFRPK